MNKRIDKIIGYRELFIRKDYKFIKNDLINPKNYLWSRSKRGIPIINYNDMVHLDVVQFIKIPLIFKQK